MTDNNTVSPAAEGADVRMYPNNALDKQVRAFEDTFSGYDLLRQHCAKK